MNFKLRRRSHNLVRGVDSKHALESLVYRECLGVTGGGVLRLRGSVLRVRGTPAGWNGPLGPLRLTPIEIAEIGRVLDRCGIWRWQRSYRLRIGRAVRLDGLAWSLRAKAGVRRCRSEGVNACPSWLDGADVAPDPAVLRGLVRGIRGVIFGQGPSFEDAGHTDLLPGSCRAFRSF